MGYIHDVERQLRKLLDNRQYEALTEDDERALVMFVKEKILESYRNGQASKVKQDTGAPQPPNKPARNYQK